MNGRWLTMRLLASFLLLMQALIAQQASFEGVATNAITHEPLRRVQVHLLSMRINDQGQTSAYGATSDDTGHFSINALRAGTYLLVPQLRGFVYGQPKHGENQKLVILLKAGQKVSEFKLEMMPRAVIAGRVIDEFGDPVRSAEVEAEQVSSEIVTTGSLRGDDKLRGQTDERGVFLLSGYPAKYYVHAQAMRDLRDIRTEGVSAEEYATTYYPSASGKDTAAAVEAGPGADVAGIDIRLIRSAKPQYFSVTGTVTDIPEGEASGCHVVFQAGEKRQFAGIYNTGCERDGTFTMRGLPPGSYRIAARHSFGASATTVVRLEKADVQNIQLVLRANMEVTGKTEVEGGSKPKGRVRLTSTMRLYAPVIGGGEIGDDGSFRLTGVPLGEFAVTVDPLPEQAYLKSIHLNGAPVSGRFVNIERPGANMLKILVSLKAAQLSGIARGQDGGLLADGLSLVYLISDIEHAEPQGNDSQRSVRVGEDGKFSFKTVRPGRYRLIALDARHWADYDNAQAFRKLASAAEEFELKEGDQLARDVVFGPDRGADAKAK